jgi:hypothetical protein
LSARFIDLSRDFLGLGVRLLVVVDLSAPSPPSGEVTWHNIAVSASKILVNLKDVGTFKVIRILTDPALRELLVRLNRLFALHAYGGIQAVGGTVIRHSLKTHVFCLGFQKL